MRWPLHAHLPGRDLDHSSLCNVKSRRWFDLMIFKAEIRVVDLMTFKGLPLAEQCSRCFVALCRQEGTTVPRRR